MKADDVCRTPNRDITVRGKPRNGVRRFTTYLMALGGDAHSVSVASSRPPSRHARPTGTDL